MDQSLFLGLVGLGALVLLIGIRVPIGYAMILVGAVGTVALNGPGVFLNQLKTLGFNQFSKYDLSVIPMFVLMGYVATRAGLSQDLFRAANAWFGRMRGGVAMSAIAACAGFGSVCGSSLATATTMGQVALPELKRYNYSGSLATGSLAAGGLLGILIPPSVVLVIYAIIVEANIVSMFAAALIPGLIAVVFFIVTIAIFVRIYPDAGPAAEELPKGEFLAATLGVVPVLGIFALVIGGIYLGFYNPTPAAAVGVALVALYGSVRRGVGLSDYRWALLETAKTSGMIYLILFGAELLKIFMSRGGVPQAAAEMMANSGLAPIAIIILLLAALIVLGCLMDSMSMILLVMPFFWPIVAELDLGMDPDDVKIWFGVLALIVVELGLITPPVGMNVFVISAIAKDVPMRETFKGVIPFFLVELVRLGLLIAFPVLSLWLPHLVRG